MCLPDMKCVELEFFNFYHDAPTSDKYKVKRINEPNTSDVQSMFWAFNDPATIEKIRELLTLQTESKFKPRIKNRIATSPVASKNQAVVVLPDVCKIKKFQYAPVIALNFSSEEIQPFVLNYTAKRLVCEITVYVLDPPNPAQGLTSSW